ncbi:G/U mismatch-specific DNA glycosylase [Bacillus badius]|uniref:G/U mismatch-specific DNA glycosylase n=1 Tax=Bacillus badius TaxID=1455 RepID=UPI0007B0BD9C|nr:G/U mismatch-specific DNA glycosylase [Bacillus badius]KZN99677.1 mismatch-specific DNA-glycosylase [Bacillus badius]MED0665791.1 G/U mismatch-specific DNA glycosylase [Bacillus badius]OCS85782.1 mismatch-specific DNA-glycosylase [Bacillus badius]OVE51860.1 mismatch-specific DNA-glycosylase [Bacillus badius]TDW03289.1 G/U mismatch-specific uracil-DNA glycosylase [Bacillus badius]
MEPVKDHLKENLTVLFVGFNPSLRSGETGHHFANPNNRFWTILHRAGLTERRCRPEEDADLLSIGYGLTNIVARPTKSAQEITKEEYNKGRLELKKKIAAYQPQVVCFVGKGVYQQYSGRKEAAWGMQPASVVPGVLDFVAPSSSGLVRMRMEDIVAIYKELSLFIRKLQSKQKEE